MGKTLIEKVKRRKIIDKLFFTENVVRKFAFVSEICQRLKPNKRPNILSELHTLK